MLGVIDSILHNSSKCAITCRLARMMFVARLKAIAISKRPTRFLTDPLSRIAGARSDDIARPRIYEPPFEIYFRLRRIFWIIVWHRGMSW